MTKTGIVLCFACFIVNIINAQYSGTDNYEICLRSTSKQELGQCIAIRQCPDLLHVLSRRPLSAESIDYLKRSHCGFEGLEPRVCCLFKSDTVVTQPTVSVSKHSLIDEGATHGTESVTSDTVVTQPTVSVSKHPLIYEGATHESVTPDTGVTQPTVSVSKHSSIDKNSKHESVTSDILPSTDVCGSFLQLRVGIGEDEEVDGYQWIALIGHEKPIGHGYHCAGVLISEQYVLTAAHCVKGKDLPRDWRVSSVLLGKYGKTPLDCALDCMGAPINVSVVKQIAHEDYIPSDLSQHHNIALLRLASKVSFTAYVQPICVPTTSEQLNSKYVGRSMTLAGYETENGSISIVKLKQEKLSVKSYSECSDLYSLARINLGAGQFCAGGLKRTKDSCSAYNGGPLMAIDVSPAGLTWYVTGVLSFGPSQCGLEGRPEVFTRVSEYVPWIVSHLEP